MDDFKKDLGEFIAQVEQLVQDAQTTAQHGRILLSQLKEEHESLPAAQPEPWLSITTREEWGAKPYRGIPTAMSKLTDIVIHHTASPQAKDHETAVAAMQGFQRHHQEGNGWADIAYHFLIASNGEIFQGRPFVPERIRVLEDIRHLVLGSHVARGNTGRVGVCFIGNFAADEGPTVAQWDAAVALCAWLCEHFKMDPHRIQPHSQYVSTECPGTVVRNSLPSLRARVKHKLSTVSQIT